MYEQNSVYKSATAYRTQNPSPTPGPRVNPPVATGFQPVQIKYFSKRPGQTQARSCGHGALTPPQLLPTTRIEFPVSKFVATAVTKLQDQQLLPASGSSPSPQGSQGNQRKCPGTSELARLLNQHRSRCDIIPTRLSSSPRMNNDSPKVVASEITGAFCPPLAPHRHHPSRWRSGHRWVPSRSPGQHYQKSSCG